MDDPNIKDEDKMVFKFKGHFGFSVTNPQFNYVYLERDGTALTLENLLDAFDSGVDTSKLPQPLRESGFYGKTVFSFSADVNG